MKIPALGFQGILLYQTTIDFFGFTVVFVGYKLYIFGPVKIIDFGKGQHIGRELHQKVNGFFSPTDGNNLSFVGFQELIIFQPHIMRMIKQRNGYVIVSIVIQLFDQNMGSYRKKRVKIMSSHQLDFLFRALHCLVTIPQNQAVRCRNDFKHNKIYKKLRFLIIL